MCFYLIQMLNDNFTFNISYNLYCLSDTGISKNSRKMSKKCGMNGSENNLEQIF